MENQVTQKQIGNEYQIRYCLYKANKAAMASLTGTVKISSTGPADVSFSCLFRADSPFTVWFEETGCARGKGVAEKFATDHAWADKVFANTVQNAVNDYLTTGKTCPFGWDKLLGALTYTQADGTQMTNFYDNRCNEFVGGHAKVSNERAEAEAAKRGKSMNGARVLIVEEEG